LIESGLHERTVNSSGYLLFSEWFAFGDTSGHNASLGFGGNAANVGLFNTATGYRALSSDVFGSYNTATGARALFSNTGTLNTADGFEALFSNLGGQNNTAVGGSFLRSSTTGISNSALGYQAAFSATTGSYNTAVGVSALYATTTGGNNTAAGVRALENNTTGSNNTAIGYLAGPESGISNLSNATAVGAFADVTASNSLVLGSINGKNSATADTNVGIATTAPTARLHIGSASVTGLRVEGPASSGTTVASASFGGRGEFRIDASGVVGGRVIVKENGRVGIGTASPDNLLTVNGTADKPGGGSWETFSDQRLKDLKGDFHAGLSQILRVNPVRYRHKQQNDLGIQDLEEHIGLVAQEIQKVIPEAVSEDGKGYLLVNNDPIIWAMLNAIKEQQKQIQEQRRQIRRQQKAILQLTGKVGVVESAAQTRVVKSDALMATK